jgi:CubicO group peptidase (beta-lactamase class C family)
MPLRAGDPREVGMSAERVRHLAQLARGWVERGIMPALVVLVARKGVVVLHEAFGKLTPEPDSPPLQRDSIFPLVSISKPITAACVLALVDDGLLGLNRPVQEYLPEFVGEGKAAVLVHHLLTHTSGLRDADVFALAETFRGSDRALDDGRHPHFATSAIGPFLRYSDQLYEAPLGFAPGSEMSYCNYGYKVLGEIVQRVSRMPLGDFARTRIFAPVAMGDTSYGFPAAKQDRYVRRSGDAPLADVIRALELLERPHGAGNVFSTRSSGCTSPSCWRRCRMPAACASRGAPTSS